MIHLKARSARSTATGPGSRGGHWHEPEFRRAYFRAWRAAHPGYNATHNRHKVERRRAAQLDRDRREVDELVARLAPTMTSRQYAIRSVHAIPAAFLGGFASRNLGRAG